MHIILTCIYTYICIYVWAGPRHTCIMYVCIQKRYIYIYIQGRVYTHTRTHAHTHKYTHKGKGKGGGKKCGGKNGGVGKAYVVDSFLAGIVGKENAGVNLNLCSL